MTEKIPSSIELNFSEALEEHEKEFIASLIEEKFSSKFLSANYVEGYEIQFTIGDWSGDGHGLSDDFTVISSKRAEHLRKLYFQFEGKIDDFCLSSSTPFGENKVTNQQIYLPTLFGVERSRQDRDYDEELYKSWEQAKIAQLEELGVQFSQKVLDAVEGEYLGVEEYLEILLSCLRFEDPELKIEIQKFDPSKPKDTRKQIFHFYGIDEEKRYIGFFGYGLYM